MTLGKPRILILVNNVKYGGCETVMFNIIRLLNPLFTFIYACPKGFEKITNDFLNEYSIQKFEYSKCTPSEICSIVKQAKPDIIHANGFYTSLACAWVSPRKPVISHLHNYYEYLNKWRARTILYTLCCIRYKKILACSQELSNKTVFGRIFKKKIDLVENSVDVKYIREKGNQELDAPSYDIVFVGNLVKRKDPSRFIRLISCVQQQRSDTKAAIIGDGTLLQDCQTQIKDCNGNIDMLGYKINPYPIIMKSKILILTSLDEGLPMVALEALGLGKFVIANPDCGLNTVINSCNGAICSTDNEYVDNIIRILSSYKSDYSVSKLDWNHGIEGYIEHIQKIYFELAGEGD